MDSPTRKTHFPYVFEGFKARVSRVSSKRVALGEPFRIGSKLSQSGKHKEPRRESRLFSFKSRVLWRFLLTAAPSRSSLPARSAFRIARFLIPTPSRIAKSLGLSRLSAAEGLTELGLSRVLPATVTREFETVCSQGSHATSRRLFSSFWLRTDALGHALSKTANATHNPRDNP